MTSSRHDQVVPLLGPAALGLLTSAEQQQLDRHLASCSACRDELVELTGVAQRLSALDADQALAVPDVERQEAVLAAVAREKAVQSRRLRRVQAVLAAAAALVVLTAGVVAATSMDAPAGVPLEPVAVQAPADISARAELIAHTWGVEIQLVAQGLADGQPFTVQVRTTQGEVVDAGAFLGTGERPLRCNLNASVLRADAASFTVLDASGRQVLSADL